MPFYSFEMVLVGIILLGGMTAGGIKLWLKRRHIPIEESKPNDELEKNLDIKSEESTQDTTKDNS